MRVRVRGAADSGSGAGDGALAIRARLDDEIVNGALAILAGEVRHAGTAEALSQAADQS